MIIREPSAELLAYTQLPPKSTFNNCIFDVDPSVAEVHKVVDADACGEPARIVERCGRVSWKSEAKMTLGSADDFMTRVVNIRKDESIAEHVSATLLLVTDRYASHQLVRHRIGAYTQESTHYINYSKKGQELEFMRPLGIPQTIKVPCQQCKRIEALPAHIAELAGGHVCITEIPNPHYESWVEACEDAEQRYLEMVTSGVKHYHARFVLPGCLKTEVAVTYNLRIWRYVFGLRCSPNNTPEIVAVMKLALKIMYDLCPPMFEDLAKQYLVIE